MKSVRVAGVEVESKGTSGSLGSNELIDCGRKADEVLASLPTHAMDPSRISNKDLDSWRYNAHVFFRERVQRSPEAVTSEQKSVRVYSLIDSQDEAAAGALAMGLDRTTGYRMKPEQMAHTKKRVICSDASLFECEGRVWPVGVVSMVAPNLRSKHDRFDNSADLRRYIPGRCFDLAAYYTSISSAWQLSLHALQQRAVRTGKRTIVVSPLVGIGAYMDGQSLDTKRKAARASLAALINAYNSIGDEHLVEVHMCIPKAPAWADFDAFAYLKELHDKQGLPKCNHRLLISQSDMFVLAFQSQRKIDKTCYDMALVNPSSDRAIGGGCYHDRRKAVAANMPGRFSNRAHALEEQLAHATSFMYSQCAGMNRDHFTVGKIEALKFADDGALVKQDEPYHKGWDLAANDSVRVTLEDDLDELYAPRVSQTRRWAGGCGAAAVHAVPLAHSAGMVPWASIYEAPAVAEVLYAPVVTATAAPTKKDDGAVEEASVLGTLITTKL